MSAPATPASPQTAPSPDPGTGRDAAGRFTAGNKYGPGNPFARQTAQLRKALLEVVTPEEMRQVAFTLLLRAKTGNLTAIKLLFQYVLGKPAEGVDPDRLEVEEWRLAQESKVNVADMHDTVQHMPAETANVIVRHAWPCAAEANYVRVVEDELDAMDREDALRAGQAREEPAAANGDDGEASAAQVRPHTPVGGGEEEGRGEGAAREGKNAKPQAASRAGPHQGKGTEQTPGAGRSAKPQAGGGRRAEANGPDGARGRAGPSANGGNGSAGKARRRKIRPVGGPSCVE
jgi:hypothetical protein